MSRATTTIETDIIICGDCAEVMAGWPAGFVDLTVMSPPYDPVVYDADGRPVTKQKGRLRDYNGYTWDFAAIAAQLWRVTKQGGVVVWVVGDATINGSETGTSFRQALHFMELGFNLHDTMIYQKDGVGAAGSMNCYLQAFEYMFVFSRGVPKTFNVLRDRKNVRPGEMVGARRKNGDVQKKFNARVGKYGRRFNIWKYSGGRKVTAEEDIAFSHPAVFPEALARDHILSWSNPGDVVLDPMAGSGTTAKMALLLNRHYIGVDVSPEYCDLARRRVAQAAARTPEALADGRGIPGGNGDMSHLPLFKNGASK